MKRAKKGEHNKLVAVVKKLKNGEGIFFKVAASWGLGNTLYRRLREDDMRDELTISVRTDGVYVSRDPLFKVVEV